MHVYTYTYLFNCFDLFKESQAHSDFELLHPFPKPLLQQEIDPDFLKELEDCQTQWKQSLHDWSSNSLKQNDYKEWLWRNRLKSGMFVDVFDTSRYSWDIGKIVEDLDTPSDQNVIIVRFYRDATKINHPTTVNSHIQQLNRYPCTIVFVFKQKGQSLKNFDDYKQHKLMRNLRKYSENSNSTVHSQCFQNLFHNLL